MPNKQKTAEAVVIGGGVMGCSIAYQLANRKFGKIILCERDGIASGSTGGSSALIRMPYSYKSTIQIACSLCGRDDGGVDHDRKLRGAGYQRLSSGSF